MIFLSLRPLVPSLLALALTGCAVGPDFRPAPVPAPDDWSSWRSGGAEVVGPAGSPGSPSAQWWRVFDDATLDHLQQRALEASPDLQTAALRYAQARVQRQTVAAQRGPAVGIEAGASRQRTSEYAANYRVLDQLAGGNRDALAEVLGEPYTFYQAGFDASWELDLWGRVRRSVEAADADIDASAALLDAARLSIASELARSYFELRTTQRLIGLARDDIEALQTRLELIQAQVRHGLGSDLDTEGQRTQLAGLRAQLPGLLEQEVQGVNRIGLLLGTRPGELRQMLAASKAPDETQPMPDYALGLPSELVRRRPDIRAAEARLHRATAEIGIAQASLYPGIRLGAHFGSESYESGRFGEWGTRAWSIGPSLDLPIFDSGRRRSTVRLRELQQQEAAITWQQTVLKAWHEVDDALSGYATEQQAQRQWQQKTDSSAQAYAWAQARYRGGLEDFATVLDAQRTWLQARREQVASDGRLRERFVAIHKAIGGGDVAGQ
ncbi:MAG: efflux transporter outer membrane subunit [Pseudomonas aeruginosa]|jgi:NodT family efflux transporter outer membrane factor (OMF) lipoprotein|uniref:efflux transporter outer membrane subunit n=1 Tax=Pseudomonas aeruginosa TaxID=287 RepID=UPI0005BBA7DF|nr:efflux transporter outer membrane subunit [Pseudomonas aeruginosa]AYW66786.1 efflux transporter outer membrane subunit [Pseudomonas aeruginosa]EKW6683298.1 efflux transporter outer membrane subunit [Pseudomonas aeruginosa]MBG4646267.1 efflux transporter outer membrane subunit [Pseudomonas aeruginosa]MBG5719436.1 efflux transporter outer membrane subunit [Pseudomonas aeruginosa]MBG5731897.1 efflux transporter outer membrane subunit [Pseudomonas aeruginosa]